MNTKIGLCIILGITILGCVFSSKNNPQLKESNFDEKIDNSILLMYKIYSRCTTTILKKAQTKIDTLEKNVSYICLPIQILDTTLVADTIIFSLFFEPINGYLTEDPDCEFAYSIGFVGPDNDCDFIEFGDNYYSDTVKDYLAQHKNIDSLFQAKIQNTDCIHPRLRETLHRKGINPAK